MGKWYYKEIEIDDKMWDALRKSKKGLKHGDCFKCEDDIKI